MGLLEGKVAIVTGAAGTLGRAAAAAMIDEGASVVGTDIDRERLDAALVGLEGSERVSQHVGDLTVERDVAALVDHARNTFGGLDVMLNNAGVVGLEHNKELVDLDVETWEATMAVNLRSVMLGCKHAVRAMRERGGGSIINISSSGAFVGDVRNNAYCASKLGVVALTRNVAAAYGPDLIRCNAIAPGIHLPEESQSSPSDGRGTFTRESLVRLVDHCMLPRLGRPDDIAQAAVFLASDRSSYITAQTLFVNGGLIDAIPHYADTRRLGSVYQDDVDDVSERGE